MEKQQTRSVLAWLLVALMLLPNSVFASSHREAPITALDRGADVTDWYAFVSYDHPDRVTMWKRRTAVFRARPDFSRN